MPVDTKVRVRQEECDDWRNRHFAKYNDGVLCWDMGTTSFTHKCSYLWNYAELVDEEDKIKYRKRVEL